MNTTRTTNAHQRSRALLACATVFIAAALSVGTPQPVSATPPGVNGRISFMRHDADGYWQVWTANPDLSESQQITDGDYDSGWATWSPDGARLVFNSTRDDGAYSGEISDIFVMNADGTEVEKLTQSESWNEQPVWSPDGDLIAFVGLSDDEQGIYVVRPDGTDLHLVTTLPTGTGRGYYHVAPRFSPDGRSLVYTVVRLGKDGPGGYHGEVTALYVADVDGSNPHRITPWGITPGDADWSPDGRHIVFDTVVNHLGHTNRLMVVDADGSNLRALTTDHGTTGIGRFDALRIEQSFNPVWSPDGSTIMFSHFELTGDGEFVLGLQTIRPDGTGQKWVDCCGDEHQAAWGTAPLQ